jgi:lactoylglutathione lyase
MKLGSFSISLAVKDIAASRAFYEKLGFSLFGGDQAQRWLILKNGDSVIGLFEGMFENNLLTFNPGWDSNAQLLPEFEDVRAIQHHLQSQGIALTTTTNASGTGPGYLTLADPDGNQILIDQHV